jgi:hypothetical protein
MPVIETTLKKAGSAPLDFTLHDEDHSFRVAEMMNALLQGNHGRTLSDIERALLLLSAYVHDIGMSPTVSLAGRHWTYLHTGDKDLLSKSEADDLQTWLDTHWGGIQPPIQGAVGTPTSFTQSQQIFSYYCRHKHNDWSEQWAREILPGIAPLLFPNWVDDLVTLCRSHHEGIVGLRSERFTARVVGNPSQVLNFAILGSTSTCC